MHAKFGIGAPTGSRQRLRKTTVAGLALLLAWVLAACSALEVGMLVETPVLNPTATVPPTAEATYVPATAEPTTPPNTPAPAYGTLTGRVCYPSEFIPAMTAYFENVATQAVTELAIAENQATYSIALEPGTYTAYSWRDGYEFGQGVSAMVPQGDGAQIAESLRPVEVAAGSTVTADLCDPLPLDVRPEGAPFGPPSPSGLVYASDAGIGMLNAAGELQRLFARRDAVLSPDGSQVIYAQDDDIWIADLGSGQSRNLTNTPERVEHSPQWWPARPDLVLFSSHARGREIMLGPGMFPTLARTDGSGYTVLFEDSDVFAMAPSPDGVTVAYGVGPIGWLHNVDTGERLAFDPAARGLDLTALPRMPASWSIGNPAWDPTGARRLSWTVGLFFDDGTNQISTGVFDLDSGTAALLHLYAMPATDGFPPAAWWSPDGEWLAAAVWSLDPGEQGLWVWRPDGSGGRYLGPGGSLAWSPEGTYLAWSDATGSTIATRPESGEQFELPRPADHWLVDWRRRP